MSKILLPGTLEWHRYVGTCKRCGTRFEADLSELSDYRWNQSFCKYTGIVRCPNCFDKTTMYQDTTKCQ